MTLLAPSNERRTIALQVRRKGLALVPVVIAAVVAMSALMTSNGAGAQEPSATELRDQAYNPGPPPNPAAVTRGQKAYQSTCSFCHGSDATGGTGPNLLDIPVVLRDNDGSKLGAFLHTGLPESGMPAFPSLTMAQAADISAFLHFQSRSAADRFAHPVAGMVTGDTGAGKAYFNEKCSKCHSPSGDLAGIGKKYRPAMLMSRICNPIARTGIGNATAVAVTAAVTLPSGRKVTGKLIHRDEFNIVLAGPDGVQHIYSVAGAKVLLKDPLAEHEMMVAKYTDRDLHNLVAYLETLQ